MPALSESNRIAHEIYEAHIEEIRKRKGDIILIDLDQKKVLDVVPRDKMLTLIQRISTDALHKHLYLLNVNSDKPLVWAR